MTKLQKIGGWLLGGVIALGFVGRQNLSFGVRSIRLNGLITTQLIPLRISVWIANNTIGSVFVRSVSGALVSNGHTVATIAQPINKRIRSNSYVEQDILLDLHNQEALSVLFENVQSGNVNNLSFELVGEVVVGEQFPIGIKFNRIFTWSEIQQMV